MCIYYFSGNGNQTLRKRKSNFHQPSLVDGLIIRPKVDHVQLQPLEFIVINSLLKKKHSFHRHYC